MAKSRPRAATDPAQAAARWAAFVSSSPQKPLGLDIWRREQAWSTAHVMEAYAAHQSNTDRSNKPLYSEAQAHKY